MSFRKFILGSRDGCDERRVEVTVGNFYSVAASTLNDSNEFSPQMAIYTSSAPKWAVFPDGVPKYDILPPGLGD